MDILTIAFVVPGLFFLFVSAYGLVQFPDFFTRAHVVAKSETFGVMLVIIGIIVHHRGAEGTLRLLLLGTFAMIANATAIHALARAAIGPEGRGTRNPPDHPADHPAGEASP